ncbi:MAG TPA: NRDE family protein [Burkholderiales bacterium]|nr:NRDE family protein [Burkholderiales bacterium]
MCLIVFAWKAHPRYSLVLAANRDEVFDRPSARLDYWDDQPDVLGGRDIEKGGTWFATNVDGRWAAVTNFRESQPAAPSSWSRGHLVSGYVASQASAAEYARDISEPLPRYSGCNLLVGDAQALFYASNRDQRHTGARIEKLSPGVHGLSNHLLNTPWPKVQRCKRSLQALLGAGKSGISDDLFHLLADRTPANDDELPATGVSHTRERMLSSPFIVSKGYGTRASTVLLVDNDGTCVMQERSFGSDGIELARRTKTFRRTDRRN